MAAFVCAAAVGAPILVIDADLQAAQQKFNKRADAYQEELIGRFRDVDATLTSLAVLQRADYGILQQRKDAIARQLKEAYPFISSLALLERSGFLPGGKSADIGHPAHNIRVTAIEPKAKGQTLARLTQELRSPKINHLIERAIQSGKTAPAIDISMPGADARFLALKPIYAGDHMPPTETERQAAFIGAIGFIVDDEAFFIGSSQELGDVSVWREGFSGPSGPTLPIYKFDAADTDPPARIWLPNFETAVRFSVSDSQFWITASSRPSLQDLRLPFIGLLALAPLIVGLIVYMTLRTHRRARWQGAADAIRLTESEQRFKDFAEASGDWFFEMDDQLRFTWFSESLKELTGVDPATLLGKTRHETGIPDVDPETWRLHLEELAAHRSYREFVHPRVKEDGSRVWLAINANPVFDENGQFKGYRGAGRDITERVEYEQQLAKARISAEAANKSKSEFLARMSHELRTPLNAVIGFSNILRMSETKTDADNERLEFATHIHDSGQHLLSLINDLLDLSKIEAGMEELREEPIDVHELAQAAEKMIVNRAQEAGVELRRDIPTAFPKVMADRRKLLQVLINLLSNAVKFTEKGGRATLICEMADDGGIVLKVKDTGIGIAPEDLSTAFASFSQVDSALSRKVEGTGLGLPLTVCLVELHGGKIDVESEVGVGSTFSVHFPPDRTVRKPSVAQNAEPDRLVG